MKTIYIVVLLALLAMLPVSAKLAIDIDAAQFRYNDTELKWEFVYAVSGNGLAFVKSEQGYESRVKFELKLSSNVKTILEDSWMIPGFVASEGEAPGIILHGLRRYAVPPGEYSAELKVIDMNDTLSEANKSFKIILRKFNNAGVDMSSLQLAHSIEPVNYTTQQWNDIFLKNGLYVLPNPSTEVSGADPELYVYTEVYNTDKYAADGFIAEYTVFDGVGREVFRRPLERDRSGDGLVEYVKIPLNTLPTGVYELQVKILYPIDNPKDSVQERQIFYLNNYHIPPYQEPSFSENVIFERSEYATFSNEKVDYEMALSDVIATKDESIQIERLSDLRAKQRFLFRFWTTRDPDTTTVQNEALIKFRENIEYAESYFKGTLGGGWDTERGHVILKYGKPDDRDFKMGDENIHSYETWFYTQYQGGIRFIFVDTTGMGDYILVHSTALNEVYNPDWYNQYVRKPGTSPDFEDNQFTSPNIR